MKNFLLAVDGSSSATEAARFLSRLPHKDRIEVTVLTVVQAPYVSPSYTTAAWVTQAFEEDKAAARQTYEKIEKMFEGANAVVRHELREGHIAETIVQVAKERASELVVMGAKGRSNVSRILLGSTSDYVATHAPCSVLVVRPNAITGQPLKIALAYEETGPAQAALEELADVGWGSGAEVHVVAISPYYVYGFFGEFEAEADQILHSNRAVEKASDQLRQLHLNPKPHLIESEHVGEGLVRFAEQHQIDLVVVGEAPSNMITRMLMGSTSRYVLRHAACCVWITRNRMIRGIPKSQQVAEHVS
jgi:nucleotide-binding universal stress UspA family protein